MSRLKVALLGLLIGAPTLAAADPQGGQIEREQIDRERAVANARFAEQERACQQKFLVNRCLNAARQTRRAELDRLQREEIRLDDAKRREAAAARTRELEQKAAVQAARASEAPIVEGPRPPRPQRPPHPIAASAPPVVRPPTRADPAEAARRSDEERRNVEDFEARTRAAQAHREEVERRNAERAARGKAAAPLPPPPGASAPP